MKMFLVTLSGLALIASNSFAAITGKAAEKAMKDASEIKMSVKTGTGVDMGGVETLARVAVQKGDSALVDVIRTTAESLKTAKAQENMKSKSVSALVGKIDGVTGKAADISSRLTDVAVSAEGQQLLSAMEASLGILRDVLSTGNLEQVDLARVEDVMAKLASVSENDVKNGNPAKVAEIEAALGNGKKISDLSELCRK